MVQQTATHITESRSPEAAADQWLTARAVIDATGIAKTDLIQFIRLNVLPRSLMRVVSAKDGTRRKKSYFSTTILGHVAMLKLLRDEGHSIATIAEKLGPAKTQDHKVRKPPQRPVLPPHFHLPASALGGSAFFVNGQMTIDWVRVAPDDALFGTIREEMDDDPAGTVFDILLRASLKELVFNWQPLFSFIYRFLEGISPPEQFGRIAPLVSAPPEGGQRTRVPQDHPPARRPQIDSCPIRLDDDRGRTRAMRLYAMALSEGALFVFEKESGPDAYGHAAIHGPASAPQEAADPDNGKTPFSVISARLDDSQRLVDTLLPEAYCQLISRIWKASDRIVESYGGHRARRSGTEVQYLIPRHAGTDPAYDAIRCAVEIREKVDQTGTALKQAGGWITDIRLNMGISSGKDHLPAEDPTASVAFMLPGGAADQALHLSTIARGGSILITKSAFGHLSQAQMESVTFGVYRDDRLFSRIFARLSELPRDTGTSPAPPEIRSLFVTQIVDIRTGRRRRG